MHFQGSMASDLLQSEFSNQALRPLENQASHSAEAWRSNKKVCLRCSKDENC